MTGHRDTATWYADRDPLAVVSPTVLGFAASHAGTTVLDLGSGTGGYARRLTEMGHRVVAADVREAYVRRAGELGVPGVVVDGAHLPFRDGAFDTVMILEVLEHLEDPASLVRTALRVARRNVLITVPDSTHVPLLAGHGLTFDHVLEQDHRQAFTNASLMEMLRGSGCEVHVEPGDFVDSSMTRLGGNVALARAFALAYRLHLRRPRLSARLFAEMEVR